MADGREEVVLQAIELLELGIGAGEFLRRRLELARLLLELAAVGDHLPGFLEDRHDLLEAEGLALGDRGDHGAGRGGADAAGKQALDEGDQLGIRLRAVADRLAAPLGIVAEGAGGAVRRR